MFGLFFTFLFVSLFFIHHLKFIFFLLTCPLISLGVSFSKEEYERKKPEYVPIIVKAGFSNYLLSGSRVEIVESEGGDDDGKERIDRKREDKKDEKVNSDEKVKKDERSEVKDGEDDEDEDYGELEVDDSTDTEIKENKNTKDVAIDAVNNNVTVKKVTKQVHLKTSVDSVIEKSKVEFRFF